MAEQVTVTNQTTGEVTKMLAPANIVLTCPPPGRNDKMVRPGQYTVTELDKMEASTQVLYDILPYAAAGQANLTFFQTPVGAGGRTLASTNMQAAGMLPSPQKFLIMGVGVRYFSGLAADTLGAAASNSILNDTNAILRTGVAELNISSKNYFTTTPLAELPVRAYVDGVAALANATTPAASLASKITVAKVTGDVFKPNPLLLEPTMNFNVRVSWDALVPVPSADANARLGVYLYGILYRPPQ